MSRTQRNNVDYFPHSVNHGKKMFYLRGKYGNNAYAVWFMLLEELGKADYHYLDLKDPVEIMYLSSSFMVDEVMLIEIISTLVSFGEFNQELWEAYNVLYNEKFVKNIEDAYRKRNNECIDIDGIRRLLASKGRSIEPKGRSNGEKFRLKGAENTQSKLKESKEDNTKENNFDLFWNLYPKKVAKAECEKAFNKLSSEEQKKILETVEDFANYKPFDTYNHPNPKTYLNQRRWDDVIEKVKTISLPQHGYIAP